VPLESRGDPQADHRRRHDGERQDARHEEADPIPVAGRQHVDRREEREQQDRDDQGDEDALAASQAQQQLDPRLGEHHPPERGTRRP
jgi:hypothetical protein